MIGDPYIVSLIPYLIILFFGIFWKSSFDGVSKMLLFIAARSKAGNSLISKIRKNAVASSNEIEESGKECFLNEMQAQLSMFFAAFLGFILTAYLSAGSFGPLDASWLPFVILFFSFAFVSIFLRIACFFSQK